MDTLRQQDIRRVAKILRDGGYDYDGSKHLIAEARKRVGLTPPKRKRGSVDRLTRTELERFLDVAYKESGVKGVMLRTLLETGSRVSAFCTLRAEDLDLEDLELHVKDKGNKTRDIPILKSLANELRLHLRGRTTGYVFPSPRGEHYTPRRLQQIVKEVAKKAEIEKNVYPHLLRHTIAQHLADNGMPENLLQKFLGHDNPKTTQVYYQPARVHVKSAFKQAMKGAGDER